MSRGRIVLAIDPGLDRAGGALVLQAAGARDVEVLDTFRCITAPAAALPDRLTTLFATAAAWRDRFDRIVVKTGAEGTVALEVPVKHFAFLVHKGEGRSERASARPMSLFWQALGAIRVAVSAGGATVLDLSSSTTAKAQRHQIFARYLTTARNEDERDAIVLGCRVLLETISPVRGR